MSKSPFFVVPLDKKYNRTLFKSGVEPLDQYFQKHVTQDIRRRIATCFVALSHREGHVAGYYTLASASVMLADLPPTFTRKLPRYPTVPAVRMGRLAVDQTFQKKGLGSALLADAIARAARAEIASYALIVDAKDEKATTFYQYHGFFSFSDRPLTLFLPL